MLRSLKEILRCKVRALDDTIGQVDDFLFDDQVWVIRYLVVKTGSWLAGRRVLISPVALQQPYSAWVFPLNLTRGQIEASPDINTDEPISRQQESALFDYYQWPTYWSDVSPIAAARAGMSTAAYLKAMRIAEAEQQAREQVARRKMTLDRLGDPNLRSARKTVGFQLQTKDGQLESVSDDLLIDEELWTIRYMVVDMNAWGVDRKTLIPSKWLERVSWTGSKIEVNLSRHEIEGGLAYDSTTAVDDIYENKVHDYYIHQRAQT